MDAADVAELEKRLKESAPEHARHQSSTDSWEEMAASKTQAAWADADQIVKKRVAEEVLLKEYEAQAELQAATAASHTAWKEAALQARDDVSGAVKANGRDTKSLEHAEIVAAQAAADAAWEAATKRAHTSVTSVSASSPSTKASIAALSKASLEAEAAKEKAVEREARSNAQGAGAQGGGKRGRAAAARAEDKEEEAGRRARAAEELSLEMRSQSPELELDDAQPAEGAAEGAEGEHDDVLRHDLGLEEIGAPAASSHEVTQAERQAKARRANQLAAGRKGRASKVRAAAAAEAADDSGMAEELRAMEELRKTASARSRAAVAAAEAAVRQGLPSDPKAHAAALAAQMVAHETRTLTLAPTRTLTLTPTLNPTLNPALTPTLTLTRSPRRRRASTRRRLWRRAVCRRRSAPHRWWPPTRRPATTETRSYPAMYSK